MVVQLRDNFCQQAQPGHVVIPVACAATLGKLLSAANRAGCDCLSDEQRNGIIWIDRDVYSYNHMAALCECFRHMPSRGKG